MEHLRFFEYRHFFVHQLTIVLAVMALVASGNPAIAQESAPAIAGDTQTVAADTILTADHVGGIVVAADGVTLDCAGHSVIGPGFGTGIGLTNRSNVTVKNCEVTGFDFGILLMNSTTNTILDNVTKNNSTHGISLNGSDGNYVGGNEATDNGFSGIDVSDDSTLNRIESNRSEGSQYGFVVYQASGNTLVGNTAVSNLQGIHFNRGTDNLLESNVTYANADFGIGFFMSTGNRLVGNTAEANEGDGIHMGEGSDANSLSSNTASNNLGAGLSTYRADSNTFETNESTDNGEWGLILNASSNNVVTGTTVTGSNRNGLVVWSNPDDGSPPSVGNAFSGNSVSGSTFDGMSIGGNARDTIVTGNEFTANGASGLNLHTSVVLVEANTVTHNAEFGIGMWDTEAATIRGNTVSGSGVDGIHVSEGSIDVAVVDNTVAGNARYGIVLYRSAGHTVDANEVSGSGPAGIYVAESDGNTINGNKVHDNAGQGIDLRNAGSESQPNLVSNNRVQANGGWGIDIGASSFTTVTGNHVMHSGRSGISAWNGSDHTTIADNQVIGNGNAGIEVSTGSHDSTVSGNVANSNAWSGVQITHVGTSANLVTGNEVADNTFVGIAVLRAVDNSVTDNVATGNGVAGFVLAETSGNELNGNVATGHDADGGDGVWGYGFHLYLATDNVLNGNAASGNYHGFRLDQSNGNTFGNNLSEYNVAGFDIVASDSNLFESNVAEHNNDQPGFAVRDGSSFNTLNANTATHNKIGFAVWQPSAGNAFSENYARNSWLDGADWAIEGANTWEDNDFKWTLGSGGWR